MQKTFIQVGGVRAAHGDEYFVAKLHSSAVVHQDTDLTRGCAGGVNIADAPQVNHHVIFVER